MSADPGINWTLLQELAVKPHKHLNITKGGEYGVMAGGVFDTGNHGIGEVMTEARTVQHLCDLAGIPEGTVYDAHIDARVWQLLVRYNTAMGWLERIASRHSRITGPGGMFDDYCMECGEPAPCDTRRMADGTYVDEEAASG